MTDESPLELDADERDAFLGRGGTGVISFATDEETPPHSVPISYGYDAEHTTFYFRLAVDKERTKAPFVDRPVTFVVFGEADDRWESVVATGRLEPTDTEGIETETLDGLDRVHIPLVDIFDAPVRTVSFDFFRLVPDELTGRKESTGGV
jgi:hypothetical protein